MAITSRRMRDGFLMSVRLEGVGVDKPLDPLTAWPAHGDVALTSGDVLVPGRLRALETAIGRIGGPHRSIRGGSR